jgi:hypothetical protein
MKRLTIFLFLTACGTTQIPGPQGIQGLPGPIGSPGPAGLDGRNCSVIEVSPSIAAPNGGALISCPDGSESLVLNGINGTNGLNGEPGEPGAPGTLVTPIQFCEGTSSYPSAFPEVGFCINSELYAVYSTHGGFLTLIPPGEYSSNAVGSKCNFKVLANCEIVRE